MRRSGKRWTATFSLAGLVEYGHGKSEEAAVRDLVTSLGDYRTSLERQESRLGESALLDLETVRALIERAG